MDKTFHAWICGGIMLIVLGCGQDTTGPILRQGANLYWQLKLNHHAVTLALEAPYNTVQLEATSYSAAGIPLSGSSTVRYTVVGNDPSVDVSPAGLVTALAPKSGVRVEVALTLGGVTQKDSVWINVTQVPIVPAPPIVEHLTFRIGSMPTTTVDCSMNDVGAVAVNEKVIVQAVDQLGDVIDSAPVALSSTNEQAILVGPYTGILEISCLEFGPVWLRGEATVYGKKVVDSVQVTVTPPRIFSVTLAPIFRTGETEPYWTVNPGVIEIVAGGAVVFSSSSSVDSTEVVFEHPGSVVDAGTITWLGLSLSPSGGGNIPSWAPKGPQACQGVPPGLPSRLCAYDRLTSGFRTRRFPTPGTYHFQIGSRGMIGTIIVREPAQ